MKIAVIGAGVSGMSFARLCQKDSFADVVLFEASSSYGGIAKVKDVAGLPYHLIGGHCFNSKHQCVLDFVFNEILSKDSWNLIDRNADIIFQNNSIPYPIEYSIKEIASFNPSFAISCVKDFIAAQQSPKTSQNLHEWLINNFGSTLAEEYLIPYNTKIWGRDISTMSPNWVVDKLPQPNIDSFIKGLIGKGSDQMPHSRFYYPKSGSQQEFIDSLRTGLDIRFNCKIEGLVKSDDGLYNIGGEVFDKIIYTGPLDQSCNVFDIPQINPICPKLKFNAVTTMFWERETCDKTWTYLPDKECLYHRLIHIGNFLKPNKNVSMAECVGEHSYDEMVSAGLKLPGLIKPLGYHVSKHAYVVFDDERDEGIAEIMSHLVNKDIHCLGRFGEWEYYNMDICILSAMKLIDKLKDKR